MAIKDPELLTEADFPVAFGRYTLTGLLGEGGMGRVFRAKQRGGEGFEKDVAVKVVRNSAMAHNPGLSASLRNEARIGAKLKHTNIVDTYDFTVVDGIPMIAMELLKGLTLQEVMAEGLQLAPRQVVALALGVAEGLEYAHEFEDGGVGVHLVHRDLKPSNIFVTPSGTVKVLDFGIAKASEGYGEQTATGFAKGTFGYMSPEQFETTQLDGRADLFSLGVILYELVCGERLFKAETLPQLVKAMMRLESIIEADDFAAKIDGVVPGLGAIVRCCLRESRDARYADASELGDALRALLHSLPVAERLGNTIKAALRDRGQSSGAPDETRVVQGQSVDTPEHTRAVNLQSPELSSQCRTRDIM